MKAWSVAQAAGGLVTGFGVFIAAHLNRVDDFFGPLSRFREVNRAPLLLFAIDGALQFNFSPARDDVNRRRGEQFVGREALLHALGKGQLDAGGRYAKGQLIAEASGRGLRSVG